MLVNTCDTNTIELTALGKSLRVSPVLIHSSFHMFSFLAVKERSLQHMPFLPPSVQHGAFHHHQSDQPIFQGAFSGAEVELPDHYRPKVACQPLSWTQIETLAYLCVNTCFSTFEVLCHLRGSLQALITTRHCALVRKLGRSLWNWVKEMTRIGMGMAIDVTSSGYTWKTPTHRMTLAQQQRMSMCLWGSAFEKARTKMTTR